MRKLLMLCLLLSGCADMQMAWKLGSVPLEKMAVMQQTVFNKPCQLKHEQVVCPYDTGTTFCNELHRANATFYGANTVVNDSGIMNYFYCAPGLPLFKGKYSKAWLIRHDKVIKNASEEDYNRVVKTCDYEATKATVNTSPSAPRIAFLPTNNYLLNQYQLDNMHNAETQKLYDNIRRDSDKSDIKRQCVEVNGYYVVRSSVKRDFDDLEKYCPGIDNLVTPCFIPD